MCRRSKDVRTKKERTRNREDDVTFQRLHRALSSVESATCTSASASFARARRGKEDEWNATNLCTRSSNHTREHSSPARPMSLTRCRAAARDVVRCSTRRARTAATEAARHGVRSRFGLRRSESGGNLESHQQHACNRRTSESLLNRIL